MDDAIIVSVWIRSKSYHRQLVVEFQSSIQKRVFLSFDTSLDRLKSRWVACRAIIQISIDIFWSPVITACMFRFVFVDKRDFPRGNSAHFNRTFRGRCLGRSQYWPHWTLADDTISNNCSCTKRRPVGSRTTKTQQARLLSCALPACFETRFWLVFRTVADNWRFLYVSTGTSTCY